MTQLSVNVNKVATLRNARGGQVPDVLKVALDCEQFGAQGITVHPRPDERHIRYADVYALRPALHTEFNIEGNPIGKFVDLVLQVKPAQVTMSPMRSMPLPPMRGGTRVGISISSVRRSTVSTMPAYAPRYSSMPTSK